MSLETCPPKDRADIGSTSKEIGDISKDIGSTSKDIGSTSKDIGSNSKDIGSTSEDIGNISNDIRSVNKIKGTSKNTFVTRTVQHWGTYKKLPVTPRRPRRTFVIIPCTPQPHPTPSHAMLTVKLAVCNR